MSNRSVFLPNYSIGDSAYDEIIKVCSNYGKKLYSLEEKQLWKKQAI